MTQPQLKPIT